MRSFALLAIAGCAALACAPSPPPPSLAPAPAGLEQRRFALGPDVERVLLNGVWARSPGDDPDPGSAPAAGDTVLVEVPGPWSPPQPAEPVTGFFSLRAEVDVTWATTPEGQDRWRRLQPAIALDGAGDAYEVFVGGERIGGHSRMPDAEEARTGRGLELRFPEPRAFFIPASAVDDDGRLRIALRVWRSPDLAKFGPRAFGVDGVAGDVLLGRFDELQAEVERRLLEKQHGQTPIGPLGAVLLFMGLYHIQLFRRRQALREYLWLGLLLVVIGAVCTVHTWWWDAVTLDEVLRIKISIAVGFLIAWLFIQFLWPFLGKPLNRFWRGYQIVQLAGFVLTMGIPGTWFMSATILPRSAGWLPWLFMAPVLVISTAIKPGEKRAEARTILIGLVICMLFASDAIVQNLGIIEKRALDGVLLSFTAGMTAFMLSMAVSLSNRFMRVYNSVDELNRSLEVKNKDLVRMNVAASRFVPSEYLKILGRENLVEVRRGDHMQKVMSVLFSDIRSFTTLVEGNTPEQNFRFINDYLGHMEPPIQAEGGFIDSYIGDAIMALFDDGAQLNSADHAVRAGIGDLRALEQHNRERVKNGEAPLKVGIGVNSGLLTLGTIGGRNRLNCGVIGDTVNLAARVESMTKMYGASFFISELTHDRLADPGAYAIRVVDRVRVKGKKKPVTIYEVLDGLPPESRDRRLQSRAVFVEGWRLFQERDVKGALDRFQQALKQAADDDDAARLWIERCQLTLAEGLPADFDGVVELKTK